MSNLLLLSDANEVEALRERLLIMNDDEVLIDNFMNYVVPSMRDMMIRINPTEVESLAKFCTVDHIGRLAFAIPFDHLQHYERLFGIGTREAMVEVMKTVFNDVIQLNKTVEDTLLQ